LIEVLTLSATLKRRSPLLKQGAPTGERRGLCRFIESRSAPACSGDGCKNKPLAEARGLLSVLERDYLPVFSIVMPPGVCWFFFSSFALRVAMVLSRH
jgi:hypothetical protein